MFEYDNINLEIAVLKLLHLNMRATIPINFLSYNNFVQPEDQDPLKNIHLVYGNTHENKFTPTSLGPTDNKLSFLNSKNQNKPQKQIEFSPRNQRVRDFLRHTTYVNKPDLIIEKKKTQLHNSTVIVTPESQTKSSSYYQKSQVGKYSNRSSPVCANNLKTYGNQQYDKLASKVQSTASFIQELKRFKEEKTKAYQPSKYSHLTSETQKHQQTSNTNYIFDNGFRKKLVEDFYTPKPESTGVVEKNKRDFTPAVVPKKIISPSHRKAVCIEDFILQNKLGGGKFGTVYKAFHIKTRSVYALKKIPKKMLKDHMMVAQFTLQVKLQTFLKHQNILEIYGVFDDKEHVYLILEYMSQGTLYSQLKKNKKLSEEDAAVKIKQIAKAIVYMHQNGVVHRDIKPQNIVMSGGVCKLCDFGWATVCDDRRKTYCGTFDYAAPEILEGAQYDLSVDLWCLGVLAYQLMVGKAPFYHISRKQTISNILNVESKKINYPNTMSMQAISFINCLLKKKPQQRLGYDQILNHPFLRQVDQKN